MTKPLSTCAQAVMDAFHETTWGQGYRSPLAAALKAAADRVVPDERIPSGNSAHHLMNWTKALDQYYQRQQTRDELLAIAAELEAS
jgi:hypothetical protein